ncbi:MAG: ACP S-malonyltransferase, partial [Pseudomonadota bacterium]
MSKKRVVVVCPGRGSYTKETLGYLSQRPSIRQELENMNSWRESLGYPSLTNLDEAEKFKVSLHTKGEHASPLIYACAFADFLEINREAYEVVAITGNSMGWYLTLAFAGALSPQDSFQLIQTMGAMMKEGLIGGQIIYPIVDENWHIDRQKRSGVLEILEVVNQREGHEAYLSIELGGYFVLAGNNPGLEALKKELPPIENYPFQLVNHGAFHTPMLREVSHRAFSELSHLHWQAPSIPMIDGRGHIWTPYSSNLELLKQYTLGEQVSDTYDFTSAVSVALKEFAPDHLILLGPGNSLGGAIG